MYIKSRFLHNGTNCYEVVDNSGFAMNYTVRGLYDLTVMDPLIESGYKFLDYHGHILTPEGISIESIVESPNTLTENEINMMLEMDVCALSEAEAAEYFTRDVQFNLVELSAGNITIHTREEFIEYLNTYIRLEQAKLAASEFVPINYFVAPEALFTLEEVQTDARIQYYMSVIERRRVLKSFEAYKNLIKFLQKETGLSENCTPDEVKAAYLSWGLCGIKTMATHKSEQIGVTTSIYDREQVGQVTGGNQIVTNLMDKAGTIYSLSGVQEITFDDDFDYLSIRPANEKAYFDLRNSTYNWSSEYKAVNCIESKSKSRTKMSLIDNSGVSYEAKIDNDVMLITTVRGNVISQRYLTFQTYGGDILPIENIGTASDYDIWAHCYAKAHDLVNAYTMKSDIGSTYELLEKEGMHKKAIIQYMARRIEEDRGLNNMVDSTLMLNEAADLYDGGIPKEYIQKYNPDNIAYESVDELIDIMQTTKENLEARGEYLAIDESSSFAKIKSQEERKFRPVEQLIFAKEVREGAINIDEYAAGRREDGSMDYTVLANFLRLCYKQFGRGKTIENYLRDIEVNNDEVNIRDVFKDRTYAYWGAIKDTANLNRIKAEEAVNAVYVTAVFREISNASLEEQRHYSFECISLDLSNKKSNYIVGYQRQVATAVEEAILRQSFEYQLREALKIEKSYIALDLMFKIAFDDSMQVEKANGKYIVSYKHVLRNKAVTLDVELPIDLYTALGNASMYTRNYCKLSDWCLFDFANGFCRMCCLNANITPWRVMPKHGFNISSYNFGVNYLSEASFGRINEELRENCLAENAKITVLKDIASQMLVPDTYMNGIVEYTVDDMDMYLYNDKFLESMDQYFSRFSLTQKLLSETGQTVRRFISKSDIMFKNFIDKYSSDYLSETEVMQLQGDNSKSWTRSITVVPLGTGGGKNLLGASHNVTSYFNINEEAYTDVIRWPELLRGAFEPATVLAVYGSKLLYIEGDKDVSKDLDTITRDECDALAEAGVFYKLSAREYLIKATNVLVKLEVR